MYIEFNLSHSHMGMGRFCVVLYRIEMENKVSDEERRIWATCEYPYYKDWPE